MKMNKKLRNVILLTLALVMTVSTVVLTSWGVGFGEYGVYDSDEVPVSESGNRAAWIYWCRAKGGEQISYRTQLPDDVKDAATEQIFSDVQPGEWYFETVNILASNGIIQGDPDGKFRPNDYITEGEFVTMLCRAMTNFDEKIEIEYPWQSPWGLIETPVTWADSAVFQQFKSNFYFLTDLSYANNDCPRGTVVGTLLNYIERRMPCQVYETLENKSLIDVLCNDAKLDAYVINLLASIPDDSVTDDTNMNAPSKFRVGLSMMMGILKGDENGYLNLLEPITRAEVCQMFLNVGFWKADNYTANISTTVWGN